MERVHWASQESGYAVLRVATPAGPATVVGTVASLAEEGVFASFEGRFETHAVHGHQFRAEAFLVGSPRTEVGLVRYLSSAGVRGVGENLAGAVVETFGMDTLRILEHEPERLTEVSGIGPARATAIAERWQAEAGERAATILLRGLDLTARQTQRIRDRYGDRTVYVVTQRPYRLAMEVWGIGFRTADALARRQGVAHDDPQRVQAAVFHVLDRLGDDGHCFVTRQDLARRLQDLNVPSQGLNDALQELLAKDRAVVEAMDTETFEPRPLDRVYSVRIWRAEHDVAAELASRAACDREGEVAEVRDAMSFTASPGVQLDEAQADAVRIALSSGITVITGGPGTGKTTLVRALVRAARERGEEWLLASPTGRAARRLSEATGAEAKTVHRLLEYRPVQGQGMSFCRDRVNPLACDGLVIDEASMVDLELMNAIVAALPASPNLSVVLVGDADQLPSVGAGQVLRDLIQSEVVSVVRLDRIYRQGEGSGIVSAAREILHGQVPDSGEKAGYKDFFRVLREDATSARGTIVDVVAERLVAKGFDALREVQVIAPTRRGPLGTEALNQALQDRLNPGEGGLKKGDLRFRARDRVICTRNRYDLEVFNGDVGRVDGVHAAGLDLTFEGDGVGRRVRWPSGELGDLDLAYAITVHKSQGSEYPAVVLALHRCHGLMLRRNLVYTAVTRARRFFCAVGSDYAWQQSVTRATGDERSTRLSERLIEAAMWSSVRLGDNPPFP